jgi:succinate dehydrogenase flavin-adding protein (antitoxin of CptAB toxin-antitoxin module)
MDARRRERVRWRARRGLLELDLVFARFFAGPFEALDANELEVFEILLRMPDNDLLDQIMRRAPPLPDPVCRAMIDRLAAL